MPFEIQKHIRFRRIELRNGSGRHLAVTLILTGQLGQA
jgi:hypothetical protein